MRWAPGDRGNIEDARGGSGFRMGGGVVPIGLGGLILLALFSWLTGTNFLSLLNSTEQSAPTGQSAPVIANGKLYAMGYTGTGPDLQEGIACFDAETGQKHWQQLYNDYLSDTIYLRYATASPAIDPETGNVYIQGTQGILPAFSSEGKLLWQHSLMEEFGRLTFPNSRTATPAIDGDLVITRGITAAWGAYGPPGDRFYAFDKKTGELVWSSSPDVSIFLPSGVRA